MSSRIVRTTQARVSVGKTMSSAGFASTPAHSMLTPMALTAAPTVRSLMVVTEASR